MSYLRTNKKPYGHQFHEELKKATEKMPTIQPEKKKAGRPLGSGNKVEYATVETIDPKHSLFDTDNLSDLGAEATAIFEKRANGKRQDALLTQLRIFFEMKPELTYLEILAALCRTNPELAKKQSVLGKLNTFVKTKYIDYNQATGIYTHSKRNYKNFSRA